MKVLFLGGPNDHETMEVMELTSFLRMPVRRELTIAEATTGITASFNMDVADYRFTRKATVNLKGEVEAVLYEFDGMEP